MKRKSHVVTVTFSLNFIIRGIINTFHIFAQREKHCDKPTPGSHITPILGSRDRYHLSIFHLMTLTRCQNLILWAIPPPILSIWLVLVWCVVYVPVPLMTLRHALCYKHFSSLESKFKLLLRKLISPLYTNKNERNSFQVASTHHSRNSTTTQCSWHATLYMIHFLIPRNHDSCCLLINFWYRDHKIHLSSGNTTDGA